MSFKITLQVPEYLKEHKQEIDAALSAGVQRSTSMLTNAAIERAPRRTGTLKRSIHSEVSPALGRFTGTVVQDSGVAKYGSFVEFGTGIYGPKGQEIRPKSSPFLQWKTADGKFIRKHSVKGMRERPFMRPALKENITEIETIMQDEINKAKEKLGGK